MLFVDMTTFQWSNGVLQGSDTYVPQTTLERKVKKVKENPDVKLEGSVVDEHHLTPDKLYNCDANGVSAVPK
ncbi:hypothetical protein PR048_001569 [Dryococelus australis]|uniref:Uncharacterized protein n=1 Tax=Dryococelus australis TaxID=614101 RepID=A0ABQ9IIR7_9NEOP|nr:hypothetical protein PR048_001569 [Dryococelus australis]